LRISSPSFNFGITAYQPAAITTSAYLAAAARAGAPPAPQNVGEV
jgi:hypothetical protein